MGHDCASIAPNTPNEFPASLEHSLLCSSNYENISDFFASICLVRSDFCSRTSLSYLGWSLWSASNHQISSIESQTGVPHISILSALHLVTPLFTTLHPSCGILILEIIMPKNCTGHAYHFYSCYHAAWLLSLLFYLIFNNSSSTQNKNSSKVGITYFEAN